MMFAKSACSTQDAAVPVPIAPRPSMQIRILAPRWAPASRMSRPDHVELRDRACTPTLHRGRA